jgi:anti-sigma regulatory factor (Ser/Thr protein kinase)
MRLEVEPEDLEEIRRVVKAHLRMWRLADLAEAATLTVTELLTNVHEHAAHHHATLLIQRVPGGACIVVSDRDHTLPSVTEPDWATESGRGLFLVTRMAADWGIALTSTGKDVWVTLQSSGSTRAESLEEAAKL